MAALKLPTPKRIQMIAAAVLFVLLAGCDSVEERAQRHYEKALELIERGQAGKAIIELRNAIDLNDQFAPARFEIAKLHEMERNISGAIGNYLKAIEINPHHVEARIRAANIFIMANELERAESNLDQAFKLDPDNPDLLLSRGLLQQRKGNFEAAEQDARAALRHSPAEPRAAMIIASNQQRNGDLEGALQTIERFLEVNTRDIALNVLKINVLDALGETAELTEHLRKMKRLYPDSLEIRRILSKWYLSEEMYAEAEVELRKLQELQPGNMQPVRNLVQFITETKGKDAATRELVRQVEASERFDSRFPLQVMLAELYYNDGR